MEHDIKLNLNSLWQPGKRKIGMVYFFGIGGAVVFLFSDRSVPAMVALFGFWGTLIGWYNESNVRIHKLNNKEKGVNHE